jgi:hypothetical protein
MREEFFSGVKDGCVTRILLARRIIGFAQKDHALTNVTMGVFRDPWVHDLSDAIRMAANLLDGIEFSSPLPE